ncbi:anti-sigma-I factor RsgI family protein [Oceanobacillus kapialis]|uniref:RsgI N-terminal anti-sigma domain-containing protein n=1 Tax=Oceanobacillus kapialis TaxID=481353 RepID=A0ABW5Q4B5_9BACI
MKKGIVMEHRGTYTIVMKKDGTFHKAKPVKHIDIGQEVTFELQQSNKRSFVYFLERARKLSRRVFVFVCFFILSTIPAYFLLAKNKAFAYVSIDINPSFELKVDNGLLVKSIRFVNNDARRIGMRLKQYKNKQMETVISQIMAQSERSNLVGEQRNMLIGVSFPNQQDKHNKLFSSLNTFLQHAEWNVTTFQIPEQIRKSAAKAGVPTFERIVKEMKHPSAKNSSVSLNLNDEEKAIIHSFYLEKNRLSEG